MDPKTRVRCLNLLTWFVLCVCFGGGTAALLDGEHGPAAAMFAEAAVLTWAWRWATTDLKPPPPWSDEKMTDEQDDEPLFMRGALLRMEAKLRAEFGITVEDPIPLGAHPLIEHLLGHGAAALRPVKGCRLCGLLKAHQLIVEAIEERT